MRTKMNSTAGDIEKEAMARAPFWITNYTGANPQPSYNDTGAVANGDVSFRNDALAPGIDRRSQYFTTRSFTFGLNLDF